MAIMHLNSSKFIKTESEKMFFDALKNQLNNDFHIFYSVIWFSKDENGKKKHSECDFLIFNKYYGFLVVEVKGGKRIEYDGYNWKLYSKDSYRILNHSPIVQAEESMYYFRDYFRKENKENFAGSYAVAVAFPLYNIEKDLGPGMSEDIIISLKNMNNLESKIIKLFKYHGRAGNPKKLLEQESKFINTMNKRVTLSIAAGAIIEAKEKELEEINKVQDTIIDFLYNYREAFIIGGAGTGKTYIGMKKIKKFLYLNQKCLYLSYNQSLNEFVKKEINNPLLDCYTFDKLMVKVLGKEKYFALESKNNFYNLVKELNLPKYNLIIIDEGQDFNDDWAKSIRLFLNNNGIIYVFYDKSQNIFERNFKNGFSIDYPPFILKYNIRNTKEIYNFITEETGIGAEIEPSIIEGARPETVEFISDEPALKYLFSLITKLVDDELVDPKDITILSDRKKENTFLKSVDKIGKCFINSENQKNTSKTIKFRSIQGFKGLESSIIIYLNFIRNNENIMDKKRRLYTAYSRAKYFLYVININYLNK